MYTEQLSQAFESLREGQATSFMLAGATTAHEAQRELRKAQEEGLVVTGPFKHPVSGYTAVLCGA